MFALKFDGIGVNSSDRLQLCTGASKRHSVEHEHKVLKEVRENVRVCFASAGDSVASTNVTASAPVDIIN